MAGYKINDFSLGGGSNTGGIGKSSSGGLGRSVLTTKRDVLQDEQDDFRNDGDDRLNNGGGGNTGGGTKTTITDDRIVFNIKCNISGAGVKYNGSFIGSVPKEIRISKAELLEKGDRIIEIGKTGYKSNQKYVITLDDNNVTFVKSDIFDGGYAGLSQAAIVIKYYINDILQPYAQAINNNKELSFTLTPTNGNDDFQIYKDEFTLTVNSNGADGSILFRKNLGYKANMFPDNGSTKYVDKKATRYEISSTDLSKFRISKITYQKGGKATAAPSSIAGDNESLTMVIKLYSDIVLDIEVEAVTEVEPVFPPKITLIKSGTRTYNINTEIGVPIAFQKNEYVKCITIIVGDDILEFDDLEDGPICGVTVPHSVFEKIGTYNTKIFPFSLSDYEDSINPVNPKPRIVPKPVRPQFTVSEEIVPVKPIVTNPYINTNTNYLSNNIGSNGYNFQFTGLSNFLNIDFNSSILNNYR